MSDVINTVDSYYDPIQGKTVEPKVTLSLLMTELGSVRHVLEAYWRGRLTRRAESVIESDVDLQTRLAYKPCDYK